MRASETKRCSITVYYLAGGDPTRSADHGDDLTVDNCERAEPETRPCSLVAVLSQSHIT